MIPIFPKFKKLEVTDKEDIESFTKHYPPYSDFNFVSLWCWNTEEKIGISKLNNNLVVKLRDYITNQPIYSFLGDNQALKTITILFNKAKSEKIKPVLKLIPEDNFQKEKLAIDKRFYLKEDYSSHDYILAVEKLIYLKGKKFKSKRRIINKIKANLDIKTKILNLNSKKNQKSIISLFNFWQKIKKKSDLQVKTELAAINRLLKTADTLKLISLGFYNKDKLIGFTINEKLHQKYYMGHFGKGDNTLGISKYMEHQTAKILAKHGCRYLNLQQDLGISGLRKSKNGWHPIKFLKKFTIVKRLR